jgi:hypothetical protein
MASVQRRRRLGTWAYPPLEDIPPGPPEAVPCPPLHALRTAFDWAYLSLPAYVWSLPLRQQSDEVLRAVAMAIRSLSPGCHTFRRMARDPDQHLGEYLCLRALMSVDIEDYLADLHREHPDDPFPAQYLDPDGRWPPGTVAGRT